MSETSETKTWKDVVWVYNAVKYEDDGEKRQCDWYVEHTPDGKLGEGDWLCDCVCESDAKAIAASMQAAALAPPACGVLTEELRKALDTASGVMKIVMCCEKPKATPNIEKAIYEIDNILTRSRSANPDVLASEEEVEVLDIIDHQMRELVAAYGKLKAKSAFFDDANGEIVPQLNRVLNWTAKLRARSQGDTVAVRREVLQLLTDKARLYGSLMHDVNRRLEVIHAIAEAEAALAATKGE